ncbi:MAG: hypothetical protein NTX59_12405 [Elusimicrobia bacterium]|nr:hypothetical protein [Elusimicrobiota bacterium]
MFAAIGAFFSKWFARLRAFAMLAGAWGVLFSVITLIGFKVGFEYDDGLVFSTPAFKSAQGSKAEPSATLTIAPARDLPLSFSAGKRADAEYISPGGYGLETKGRGLPDEDIASGADYWNAVNRAYKYEHIKPIPWLTAWFFKVLGFKVEIFCGRGQEGSDSLENSWKTLADYFHFTTDENKKYELLERSRFIFYFTPSDEGVIQAKKAGVTPVRIRKNKKSLNNCLYNPGEFRERILPLSEF